MAADLKAKWSPTGFPGAEYVEVQLYRGGVELGGKFEVLTANGEVTFFAADYPGITYAANARGVYSSTPCEIEEVEGGGSGGSSNGGGGA